LGFLLLSGVLASEVAKFVRRARIQAAQAQAHANTANARADAVEALHGSEERFKALAAATFEGIVITEGGRYVDSNEQLLQMVGYSREELIGTEVASTFSAEEPSRVLDNMSQGLESRTEHRLIRKDGTEIFVEARGKTIEYQNRKVRVTAIRDISDQKLAEQTLRQNRALLHAVIEGTSDAVYVKDPGG